MNRTPLAQRSRRTWILCPLTTQYLISISCSPSTWSLSPAGSRDISLVPSFQWQSATRRLGGSQTRVTRSCPNSVNKYLSNPPISKPSPRWGVIPNFELYSSRRLSRSGTSKINLRCSRNPLVSLAHNCPEGPLRRQIHRKWWSKLGSLRNHNSGRLGSARKRREILSNSILSQLPTAIQLTVGTGDTLFPLLGLRTRLTGPHLLQPSLIIIEFFKFPRF